MGTTEQQLTRTNFIVTNAPQAYDYAYIEEIKVIKNTTRYGTVRLLHVRGEDKADRLFRMQYQKGRYQSGSYFACDWSESEKFIGLPDAVALLRGMVLDENPD